MSKSPSKTVLHRWLPASLAFAACSLQPLLAQGDSQESEEKTFVSAIGVDDLELGGQLRFRSEYRDPFPPTAGSPSQTLHLFRGRVHLDASFEEGIRGFLQLQESVGFTGAPTRGFVHQAFLEVHDVLDGLDIRGGRMELQYGNQRMVSPLDWSNVGRAWDGALATWSDQDGHWQLDAFTTHPVAGQGGVTGNEDFHGLYGQYEGDPIDVDVYVFKRRDMRLMLDDWTFGALVERAYEDFWWSAEAALQSGDHGLLSAGGTALALRAGLELDGGRVGVGYEYASGDSNPTDTDQGGFIPLFNFVHSHQGYQDLVIWRNLQDIILFGSVPLSEDWSAKLDIHFLSRVEANDALYTGLGATGAVANGTSKNIGTEFDLSVRGKIRDTIGVWTGVSYFSAGSGIVNSDDQIWAWLQLWLDF